MDIRDLAREYVKRNHLSASTISRYVGCNNDTITKWLKADKGLCDRYLVKVKKFLEGDWIVTADQILREEKEKETPTNEQRWRDYNYR